MNLTKTFTEKELKQKSKTGLIALVKNWQKAMRDLDCHISYGGDPSGTVGAENWFGWRFTKDMRQVGFLQGWYARGDWMERSLRWYQTEDKDKRRQLIDETYSALKKSFTLPPHDQK